MNNNFYSLAKIMYGTSDLTKLSPRQLDNLTNKITNTDPSKYKKISGNKYSGKTRKQIKQIF